MTVADSIAVDEALLVLKVLFLVLLYLFIWRIVRARARRAAAAGELHPPAGQAEAAGLGAAARRYQTGVLVVLRSPALEEGASFELDSAPVTIGRGGQNDIQIESDEFASARHARFEPRRDGVWVQDRGSTNGTFVNGAHR